MKNRFRFKMGKASLITGIISSIGFFIIKDLKKENSLIKNTLKIFFSNKNNNNKIDPNNIKVINEDKNDDLKKLTKGE